MDIVGDVEGVLVANAKDLHHGRWLAVEARDEIGILKAIDDRGHVFELEGRAVGAGEHDDLFVFAPHAHQPLRAEQDRAILALDAASGQVNARAADRIGHLREGQAVAPQSLFGDFDGNLIDAHALEPDLRNNAAAAQVVAHSFGRDFESLLLDIAVEHHVDGLIAASQLLDNRLFDLGGEGVDAVDFVFDVVEEFVHVGTAL